MKVTWKSFEDFSTLIVDKGIVEDHLPTEVLGALKLCHRQHIDGRYNASEMTTIRERRWEESTMGDPVVTALPVGNAYQSQRYPTTLTVVVDLEAPVEHEPSTSLSPHWGERGEHVTAHHTALSEAGLVASHTVRTAREDSYHENGTDPSTLTNAASGFMQAMMMTSSGGWGSPSNPTQSPDVAIELSSYS